MDENKIIKGQAWISATGSLLQDQICIYPDGRSTSNVVALIPDVWENLFTGGGNNQEDVDYIWTNNKGFYFWKVKTTDIGDDSIEVDVFIQCPKPRYEDIDRLLSTEISPRTVEINGSSVEEIPWVTYWAERYRTTLKNAEDKLAIQKKEIVFPGTSYIDQHGNTVEVEEKKETNYELGSIANLLSMF